MAKKDAELTDNKVEMTPVGNKSTRALKRPETVQADGSLAFRPIPHAEIPDGETPPIWLVRFDVLNTNPPTSFGLEMNGDVVLGSLGDEHGTIDLSKFGSRELGVSRQHVRLHPTDTDIFAIDLKSTNGTRRNGRVLGPHTPHSISDGDVLQLGGLSLGVSIVKAPPDGILAGIRKQDFAESLVQLATVLTSKLKLEEVLERILEMTLAYSQCSGAALWLIDEQTGELFLTAERGIGDRRAKIMKIPVSDDYQVGTVIKTGRPLRSSRTGEGGLVKVKTDYLVQAVIYVPVMLADIPIGVLAAIHGEGSREFSKADEKLLLTISHFAAIAVQNSRTFEATDRALAKKVKDLATINDVSKALSATTDLQGVFNALRERVRKQWNVDNVGLWLMEEETRSLEPFPRPTFHRAYPIGEGVIGEVAQTGEARTVPDLKLYTPADDPEKAKESTLQLVSHSTACVPLKAKGRVIGVLGVFSKGKGIFGDEDLRLLQAFAHPTAVAIQNAQLFKRIEEQWATVLAAANMLTHPLMIVNRQGQLVLSNEAAETLLQQVRKPQPGDQPGSARTLSFRPLVSLLEGLSEAKWRTKEIPIGDKVYIATVEHASWVGTIILMQDVSEVHMVERLRMQLVESISDQIREPLEAIMRDVRQMVGTESVPEKVQKLAESILLSTQHLENLASRMFDQALLDDRVEPVMTPCDVRALTESAIADLDSSEAARKLAIHLNVTGEPYKLQGDPTRLQRCIFNLLEHAIRRSPPQSRVEVDLTFERSRIVLRFSDTGPAIPTSNMEDVFERRPTGENLALAQVKAAVVVHEGSITMRTRKGAGMSFEITLPRRKNS